MTALLRLPDLNSCSCLTMYFGCCCASLGKVGVVELPSAPWQAAQTAKLASPLARLRAALSWAKALAAEAAKRHGKRQMGNQLHGISVGGQNSVRFYNAGRDHPPHP
jgi:hypothetical protein